MLGLTIPQPPILIHSKKFNPFPPIQSPNLLSITNRKRLGVNLVSISHRNRLRVFDSKNNKNGSEEEEDEKVKKNEKPKFNMKWIDLLLNPEPDNIVAVGLTGVLTWASVQVLWQLFVVSAAILIAALKYTLVAALLIFILITLL